MFLFDKIEVVHNFATLMEDEHQLASLCNYQVKYT